MAYTTINKPSDYFNTKLYTGNGSTNAITGVGFQPDWCWIKSRSNPGTYGHELYDSIRGVRKLLQTNTSGAEFTVPSTSFESFDSDGFTVQLSDNYGRGVNENNGLYVAWNWLAGGTASSNTDGSITSTVSANTTSGFSIVTYTSTTGTVGHGLGVTPKVVLMKARNLADQWTMGHASLPSWTYGISGMPGSGVQDSNATFWNSTAPTSTVFSQGSWDNGYNKVAYCFAEIKGFSKFGSYVGNGSTDGTFIYTGFKPSFIMTKCTTTDNGSTVWGMFDNKRIGYNSNNYRVFASNSNAEDTTANEIDILSNGFKCRSTSSTHNLSGQTFIYMAFAENPLVTSTKLPATAR